MSMGSLLHVPSFCNLKGVLIRVLQRNRISGVYTEGKIYFQELTPMVAGPSKSEIHWIRLES